jgi:hypothetical protein
MLAVVVRVGLLPRTDTARRLAHAAGHGRLAPATWTAVLLLERRPISAPVAWGWCAGAGRRGRACCPTATASANGCSRDDLRARCAWRQARLLAAVSRSSAALLVCSTPRVTAVSAFIYFNF